MRVTSVSVFQSDGLLLATGSYDGFARIWTIEGRTPPNSTSPFIFSHFCFFSEAHHPVFLFQVTWPVLWGSTKVLYLHSSGTGKETSSSAPAWTR